MKLSPALLVLLLLAFIYPGCGPEKTTALRPPKATNSDDIMDVSTWDFGDKPSTNNASAQQIQDQFSIVVATFTGEGHKSDANAAHASLSSRYSALAPHLRVRDRSRGSVITYGVYSGYNDDSAKQDIKMLRTITSGQMMLSKFKSPRARRQLHPHDLWTVRREYPTIVPIYTLEVAVWGDFDSGQLPRQQRRNAAEQYAAALRGKGFEAFFYHNDETKLSSVTVGLFSYLALDPETGFYSLEVEAMMARFPRRLMNGQPVLQYYNPGNPSQGSMEQKPCLVEVPVD
jgi:hypothetical protein